MKISEKFLYEDFKISTDLYAKTEKLKITGIDEYEVYYQNFDSLIKSDDEELNFKF